jgi:hypothetical protein
MEGKESNELVLEDSANKHVLKAEEGVKVVSNLENGTIVMEVKGKGLVMHGEHGVLATEASNVIKYVQQEFNPVTKSMMKAVD